MNDFNVFGNGEDRHNFFGRDNPLRELDQAMAHEPAGILIHGLGAVGKTTLVRCFARRLLDADRITADRLFYFSLLWDIRTAEYIINHLGIELLGLEFVLDSMEERIERLAEFLRQQRCLLIWDDFEVVHGMESEGEQGRFPSQDQQHLLDLLKKLRGGNTKVLITSRSDESWLDDCFRMNLGGFEGEERWEYGCTILSDLGMDADRTDRQLAKLLDLTDGHPMAMRIMLSELKDHSAETLCEALDANLQSLGEAAMTSEGKLLATLQYVEQSVPEHSRSLMTPLAFFERFVNEDDLEAMMDQTDKTMARIRVDGLLQALTHVGLLEFCGATIYQIHPVLTRYLRRGEVVPPDESWQRRFVEVMANREKNVSFTKEWVEQRIPCYFNDLNYQTALELADRLCMNSQFCRLLSRAGRLTQNKSEFEERVRGYRQTADAKPVASDPEAEMARSYKLGLIAQQQRDFIAAAASFRHAREIAKGTGDEKAEATILHALGWVVQKQEDFETAEALYQKALRRYEKQGDEENVTNIYANLGYIATRQGHFDVADPWLRKVLAFSEERGDAFDAMNSYHLLGYWAETQRDFDAAVAWYEKSLAINEAIGNERDAAGVYYHLGWGAMARLDYDTAGKWYRKSLEIMAKQGDRYTIANIYERFGTRAYKKREFDFAKRWNQKALEIARQQNNQYTMACANNNLAMITAERGNFEEAKALYEETLRLFDRESIDKSATYHQLGIIAHQQDDLDTAEKWYQKSLEIDEKFSNEHGAAITYVNLGALARQRGNFKVAEKWLQKSLQIKEEQGNEVGAASSYHHLGKIAEEQGDFDAAEKWYRKSVEIDEKYDNELSAAHTYVYLGKIAYARQDVETAETWHQKTLPVFQKHGDAEGVLFLSTIAEERHDYEAAEKLCRQALDIAKAKENQRSEERCYYQLSYYAAEQQDYDTAEQWLQKSLEINEKHGRMKDAVWTCSTLGQIAWKHRDFRVAFKWFRKSLELNKNTRWRDWINYYLRLWRYLPISFK